MRVDAAEDLGPRLYPVRRLNPFCTPPFSHPCAGVSGNQSKTVTEYGSTSMKASMTLGPPRLRPQWMAASTSSTFRALRQGTLK